MKALVIGSLGKMGVIMINLLEKDKDFDQVLGYDVQQKDQPLLTDFPKVDVLIDFSHPSLIEMILSYATKHQIPVVIATTGYSEKEQELIHNAKQHIPIFMSSNFSYGIQVISEALKKIAQLTEHDFDIEIIEKHHNQKVDAPSGTAIHLARTINDSLSKPKRVVHETSNHSEELAIHSIRSGSIVGEHTILFAGQDEVIEIKHTAQSKSIFAHGAIKAAKWIIHQKPGFYHMDDLVKEKNHE